MKYFLQKLSLASCRSRAVNWDLPIIQSSDPNNKDGRHTCFHNLTRMVGFFFFFFAVCTARVDQNTGGALLEFPMRTAVHGESRVPSAISVCDNYQNFRIGFSTVAVAQWVRRWSGCHSVVQAESSSPGGDTNCFFQQ